MTESFSMWCRKNVSDLFQICYTHPFSNSFTDIESCGKVLNRGHSITMLTIFCTILTTYLPMLTMVDICATTYLMSTLTLLKVTSVIFSNNKYLILISICVRILFLILQRFEKPVLNLNNIKKIRCPIYLKPFKHTLPRKKYNTQKNGPVPILHPGPSKLSQLPKSKEIFEI